MTPQQLEFAELRLGSAKIRMEEFMDSVFVDIAKITLVISCITISRAAGMSSEYIDHIKFEKTGFLQGKIINDYSKPSKDATSQDIPLALYFENGTTDHFVEPRSADGGGVLHWQKDGKDYFSKGHIVKGIKPLRIMENGVNFGLDEFQNILIQRTTAYMRGHST